MKSPVRKTLCLALLILFVTLPGPFAKEQPGSDAAAESAGSMLWKISSSTGTTYVFGSIHFATPEMYPLPNKVEEAFAGSEKLVVEVDVGPGQQEKLSQLMMVKGTYPADDSLANHISPELSGHLTEYLMEAGIPGETFDQFRPWFVALTISVIELQKIGLDPSLGIDQHFLNRARGSKPILELESAEEQLAIFESLSPRLQQLMLKKTLLEIDGMEEEMGGMIDAWTRGDIDAMLRLKDKPLREAPELEPFFDKMYTERNHKMADKIAGYLRAGSTHFVTVGAGHLVGEDGVVALLERKKFTVERQ